jgi:amidohydrolase
MQSIIDLARSLEPELLEARRHLHANPELGHDLPGTVAYVAERLARIGIRPRPMGDGGLVACIGRPGRTLLLRADMDALPIAETTDLPFRATNGRGHCCGHDLHTAMLLGAAAVLKRHEDQLGGTVTFMFQPAEEIGTGAKAMVDAGVLADPLVDAALGIHVASYLPANLVLVPPRVSMGSLDTFHVEIRGKGGHSSMPSRCIDPLHAAVDIYNLIDGLAGKLVDPFETATLNICTINAGTACNVIPDSASLSGGLRTFSKATRDRLVERIDGIIAGVAALTGTTCTRTSEYFPVLNSDMDLQKTLLPMVREVVGPENIFRYGTSMPGSEDFAYLAEQVPSVFLFLGAGARDGFPHHNPNVVFDEQALATGAALYANCAMEWLNPARA